MRHALITSLTLLTFWAFLAPVSAEDPKGRTPEHNWQSHADVAKKVQELFEKVNTFQSPFVITTVDGTRGRTMSGTCYYQKPGKLRFAFDNPSGDLIVSDGKILWVYIARLGAVGKQDLQLSKKNEANKDIFLKSPGAGLSRLFRKYHYKFDGQRQPRQEDGGSFFVLDMEQREKIGGYENIKLFIDSSSYLIRRAAATDGYGKKTTISFGNPVVNGTLEGKLFQYQPGESVRVVFNPLVNEQ
ncbi:MAG: outer membrane lipoprotein carrier protein LolA [Spirochaetia bacterium]|nr:outer membrane lipoprotein carrier protein LolA [Spirochaetia bacterium]